MGPSWPLSAAAMGRFDVIIFYGVFIFICIFIGPASGRCRKFDEYEWSIGDSSTSVHFAIALLSDGCVSKFSIMYENLLGWILLCGWMWEWLDESFWRYRNNYWMHVIYDYANYLWWNEIHQHVKDANSVRFWRLQFGNELTESNCEIETLASSTKALLPIRLMV